MRDYGRFGQAGDNGTRSLLIECGFHGAPEAHGVALDQLARFLLAADTVDRADLPAAWFAPDAGAQRALRVTHAVAAKSADFRFAQPWKGWRRAARRRPDRWSEGEPVVTLTMIAC